MINTPVRMTAMVLILALAFVGGGLITQTIITSAQHDTPSVSVAVNTPKYFPRAEPIPATASDGERMIAYLQSLKEDPGLVGENWIIVADTICGNLNTGYTGTSNKNWLTSQYSLNGNDAEVVMITAVNAFCPRLVDQLKK